MGGNMRRTLLVICLVIFISGCATTAKMNKVSIGMPKNEVIDTMGKPVSTAGIGREELLRYNLYNPYNDSFEEYWVTLIDGKVAKYGRAGDYNND